MITIAADSEVDPLEPERDVSQLAQLLSLLCGQELRPADLAPEARQALDQFLELVKTRGTDKFTFDYEEFNELLLLFNQYRVQRPFFSYFFGSGQPETNAASKPITLAQMKEGVRKFRGMALLCFGNFRFAYRRLSQERNPEAFIRYLEPWCRNSEDERKSLDSRPGPLTPLVGTEDEIAGGDTWLLGYLSGSLLKADQATLKQLAEAKEASADELKKATAQLEEIAKAQVAAIERGKRNTIRYLTWDYLDVYVATSMRSRWEYEETATFTVKLFTEELKDLARLRWFDPTQSYCDNSIDKGLVESLMLKRAHCTIYMAQEEDTLGKDSELAATLAQGKPVIAYVPDRDEKAQRAEIAKRPTAYYLARVNLLFAKGFFDKPDTCQRVAERASKLGLKLKPSEVKDAAKQVRDLLEQAEDARTFQLIGDEEASFRKARQAEIDRAIDLLASVECRAADERAALLKVIHPLNMQVHLESGVANGVMIARTAKDCAELVRGVLLRSLTFTIDSEPAKAKPVRATLLAEKTTASRFRVVTQDACLTNSFWNFYQGK